MSIKLTDTQLLTLSAAAQHEDGCIAPRIPLNRRREVRGIGGWAAVV
jgi:hypothetical protein